MKWPNVSTWLKSKKTAPVQPSFDSKLIRKNRRTFLPRWSQIKYVLHFLTHKEKISAALCTAAVACGVLGLAFVAVRNHTTTGPKEGGDYSEAMVGQPKYINPLFSASSDIDADIATLIYSGLFRHSNGGILTPDLAESFTTSTDGTTYTITIKPNLRWSDGEPLTADDVVYTFDLIQNPEVGSPLISGFDGVKIEKMDNRTVRFTLKQAYAPFLQSLTTGIVPEHVWGNVPLSGIRLAKSNLQPVGSGPWQFNKLVKDEAGNIQSYVLAHNSNYYGQKPYLKTATFRFFTGPNYDQAIEAVRSQSVSAISFAPEAQTKLASKNLVSYNVWLPQYTALFFNQDTDPDLKDDAVRQALAMAIDKKNIVDNALSGNGKIIDAPILEGYLGYYPDIKKIETNIDAANTLLDKKWTRIQPEDYFKTRHDELLKNYQEELSALKKASTTPEAIDTRTGEIEKEINTAIRNEMDQNQQFYREDKNHHILRLTLTTIDTAEYEKAANLIKQMWGKIGVLADVRIIGAHQIVREALHDHNYDVILYGELSGSDPDLFPFWHSSQINYPGLNLSRYGSHEADKLLEDARSSTNDAQRADLYRKFQDQLVADLPAVFLYTPLHNFTANKEIKGITIGNISSPSDRYNDMNDWYIKTSWKWK